MNIPQFFIRNKQFSVCVFLMIAYWGYQSFRKMPKSEDPLFPLPQYTVNIVYPGATPSDLEQLVVNPLELQLGTLDLIEYIQTKISDGSASIKIKFLQKADEEKKYDEVQREINKVKPDLPAGVKSIDVKQSSTSNVSILQYALVSEDKPYSELQLMAENAQRAIQKVKGIGEVLLHAIPAQQINVEIDLPRMAANGITLTDINNAIKSEAVNLPAGYLDVSVNRYNIKIGGDYRSEDQVRNTIIKTSGDHIVYLKDVANVTRGYEPDNYFARYNGKRAVFISVTQQEDANIFDITARVEQELKSFYHAGNGIKLEKVFDQSLSVSHRLNNLYRDFCIAIVLVLFTLLPLGLRASYVVMFSIPVSIFIGIGLLDLSGYSLNQFSIVGLVIALGLLVDDSIIVVENIVAKLRKGDGREEAAINGTNQLIRAIITVTVCILLSFLPLVTLQGSTGDFIRSLPLAVIYTMAGSLLVSVTMTPLLSKFLLKDQIGDNVFYRAIMRFNEGPFMRMLAFCMKWPKMTLVVALALVLAGFMLMRAIGFSFFPSSEKPQFLVDVTLPAAANIETVDKVVHWVEQRLHEKPYIRAYAANIGKGNPQVYYNVGQSGQKANTAQLLCFTEHYDKDHFPAFLDSLRSEFAKYPGAIIQVHEFMQGPPVGTPIEIRIFGDNLQTLSTLAGQVEAALKRTPGTRDIDNPLRQQKVEVKLLINHEKALSLGVSIAEISKSVRTTFAGISATEITDDAGNSLDVNLTLDQYAKGSFDVFKQIYVSAATGKLVPLSQVAEIKLQSAPSILQHFNKRRSITVTAYVRTGYLTGKVTNEALNKINQIRFPENYLYEAGGEAEKRKESFGGLSTALAVSVFGILAVLILAFRGLRGTVIVASAIPLGILGAVVALYAGGYTFSFTAFVGIITLIGLEVKNTIIIVDFTEQMRAAGHSKEEAIQLATEERFTPIFLTTLTAVFALIPLVVERSDFFSPLALVLIGGLLSSLLLTRFVAPVLYKMIMK
ncbi:efflux RND transporter permease subunit [Chitinophaga filiformis]|uniref:Efflux RND transporter permease subunit n=1 Tax=Chitinophaga filiformis TaxID=104663 RepID=A0ABY4HUV4_CHIFI|nr:efflux RND transporter permease subunit [Chitinophaga filiformis]UPK67382.1 efflux RND transporter permease subunit [Chitinophaga filiformis]